MKKKRIAVVLAAALTGMILTACGGQSGKSGAKDYGLDPDNPVSLTVWHYYNGTQQAIFDSLIEEFNTSVGNEEGIYVEAYSKGSVSDLEEAVTAAVNGDVGAEELPDIFSTYADTAYSVQKKDMLADLSAYFTEDELSEYVDSYIEEGYLNDDGAPYLLPVAKSTEIMMINKTDWEPFAEDTGTSLDELATVEGVTAVAKRYYEWTDAQTPKVADDGKAFYGRDSMSNYFLIGMKQMGVDLFAVEDGKLVLNTDKDLIRRLWDNYYVPYVNGYFASYGSFRSDDVKTGDILAYTGSTSSTFYFPDQVEKDDESYDIDFIVCQAPIMEGGENYKVQQGAGMAVAKSDEQREYAASEFLKWFTEKENNLKFVCDSGYMPVKKEANTVEALDEVIKEENIEINDKAYSCLTSILDDFDQSSFYTPKSTENGYSARKILDYNLSDKAAADKEAIDKAVKKGASREEETGKYTTDEAFDSWYEDFCKALSEAAGN